MDIKSGRGYPSSTLSNFSPNFFVFDGVECCSMEGLLQSFKFKGVDKQRYVCSLVGRQAKFEGYGKRWRVQQKLYWNGKEYDRHSQEYQDLLNRAYLALATNERFKKALLSTGDAVLTHRIGGKKESETILTEREFCSRLTKIRTMIKNGEL